LHVPEQVVFVEELLPQEVVCRGDVVVPHIQTQQRGTALGLYTHGTYTHVFIIYDASGHGYPYDNKLHIQTYTQTQGLQGL
jgi:hypothetical protein